MLTTARLPDPYRPEAEIVAQCLAVLDPQLDWPAVVRTAQPWVQAVRDRPPPFWAMERLLQEYPISSAEGLALMRLAEALLRVPDQETALALTADQLGRADFANSADPEGGLPARLSSAVIRRAKQLLPGGEAGGLLARLGAQTVLAATLRTVQLRSVIWRATLLRSTPSPRTAPLLRPAAPSATASRSSSVRCTRATRMRSGRVSWPSWCRVSGRCASALPLPIST